MSSLVNFFSLLLYSFYEGVLSFQYNAHIYLLFSMWEPVFVMGFLERFTTVSAYTFQNSLSIISNIDYVEPVSHQITTAHSICSEYLTTPILDHFLSLSSPTPLFPQWCARRPQVREHVRRGCIWWIDIPYCEVNSWVIVGWLKPPRTHTRTHKVDCFISQVNWPLSFNTQHI